MDANNTCQAQAVIGSQAEQVVWTTILFNLLTFGLNTMSQPAGAVCGGASNLGFMLRSSPIICLIDTCYMLCRFVQLYFQPKQATTTTLAPQLIRKDRLRQAHIRLLRLRYQPWDAAKEDTDDLIQQNLQSNKTFRFLAFVLLIVQAIKFFAYEGLYWSKAIACLYLFAYITVELLTIWPRGEEFTQAIAAEREDPIASSGALSLAYFSVALAVAFLSFLGAAFIKDATNGSHESLPQHLGTASFSSWTLALLFAYGMCVVDSKLSRKLLEPTLLLVPMLGIPWAYYAFGPQMAVGVDKQIIAQVLSVGLGIAWVGVGVKYASAVTRTIRDKAGKDKNSANRRILIEKFLAWYFVLLHLLTAVLYLRFSYDSNGTSVPRWTKWLG